MKAYDMLFVVKAHLGDEVYEQIEKDVQSWITGNEGDIQSFKSWGQRDLPETFNEHERANYFHVVFKGTGNTLEIVKEKMRVDENYLRHLIVLVDSIQESSVEKGA